MPDTNAISLVLRCLALPPAELSRRTMSRPASAAWAARGRLGIESGRGLDPLPPLTAVDGSPTSPVATGTGGMTSHCATIGSTDGTEPLEGMPSRQPSEFTQARFARIATPVSTKPLCPGVWKKALYEKQPYEDNYVDAREFMNELRTNGHLRTNLRYGDMVRYSFVIVQQLSIVVIFVVVFVAILYEWLPLDAAVTVGSGMLLMGYVANVLLAVLTPLDGPHHAATGAASNASTVAAAVSQGPSLSSPVATTGAFPIGAGAASAPPAALEVADVPVPTAQSATIATTVTQNLVSHCRQSFVLLATLLLAAPIFHTISLSYANDTIWALSITCGFIHVIFADYDYMHGVSQEYSHNISVNAGIAASVLMASRMPHQLHASFLVGLGVCLVSLSPILRHRLSRAGAELHVAFTFALLGIAIGCLMLLRPALAMALVTTVVVLVLVMPYCFVQVQSSHFKSQISGPWDEAKPVNRAAAAEWSRAGLLS